MGGKESKPEENPPPPPPSPPPALLDKGWRDVPWSNKHGYLDYVKRFKPFQPHDDEKDEDEHVRILLHGPVGHGKSSFINTVESILRDRMTGRALTNTEEGSSFTKKFTTYKITTGERGTSYPFVFNDTMGLEKDQGICEEDMKLAIMGHVKDGYTFNPVSSISTDDQYYNPNPSLRDRTHVLVYLVSAAKARLLHDDAIQKMKRARRDASDKDIPQMVVLTHIDEACPEVHLDLTNVYKSLYLKKQMEVVSASLGVPLNLIFPVKNYCSEIAPDPLVEMLTLMALKQMINLGEDFVNDCKEK